MEIDKAFYESALRQTERDLAALERERTTIRGEMARMQRELLSLADKRIEWVRAAGSIKTLIGLSLSEEEAALCGTSAEKERLAQIPPDAFKEISLPVAARKYLEILGRPATHRQLKDGLRRGGINPELKHLDNSLRTALQRRPEEFVFLKNKGGVGQWELTEWSDVIDQVPNEAVRPESWRLSVVGGSAVAVREA